MFYGRKRELSLLKEKYEKKSQIIVIYGRRRVGKSQLIKEFCKDKKYLFFEGLEGESTKQQIKYFTSKLAEQINEEHLHKTKFSDWNEVFSYLTKYLQHKRMVIVFDELQWMAAGQGRLISLIKSYWDQHWKQLEGLFILCGSVANFMVNKVVKSKALYGRLNLEINLKPLNIEESKCFIEKRGLQEILLYQLLFGGIPKYLEEIQQNNSFEKNINRLCFQKDSFFLEEFDKIFYSQFKEGQTYKKIVKILSKKNCTLTEISVSLKKSPSGGLKSYLSNLEASNFIKTYQVVGSLSQKDKKYKLNDEFIIFYLKFIEPNLKLIKFNETDYFFKNNIQNKWSLWLGIAFENFCVKNAMHIARKLGFSDEVLDFGPLVSSKIGNGGYQIDLSYKRNNHILTICEIKYSASKINITIIPELNLKIEKLKLDKKITIEKCLITTEGADKALLDSKYFHHIMRLEDFFSEQS